MLIITAFTKERDGGIIRKFMNNKHTTATAWSKVFSLSL